MEKKYLIVPVLALTAILAAGATHAASPLPRTDAHGPDALITALAQKFNLNKDDVRAVFDEQASTMRANIAAHAQDGLAQAVKDGKLTQAQADAITAHAASEKAFMESLKSMSKTDAQAALKAHRAEEEQWAKDNNIPAGFLGGPRIEGKAFGHDMGKHTAPTIKG